MRQWRLIDTGKGDPYMNMAIDEAIAISSRDDALFLTMRFYQWERPALTIGYFQAIKDEINIDLYKKENIPIVRRITGGRSLLHQHELTYSITSPTGNPLFPNNIRGAYLVIARGLSAGLRILGLDNDIFQSRSDEEHNNKMKRSLYCFSSPSVHEITVRGKKIIGSAQRRWSDIFLQQGSVIIEKSPGLFMPGLSKEEDYSTSILESLGRRVTPEELKDAMLCGFREELGIKFKEYGLTEHERRLAERLYLEKYTKDKWNMKREIP